MRSDLAHARKQRRGLIDGWGGKWLGKRRAFVIQVVSLASKVDELVCYDVKFLPDGFEAFVKLCMAVLGSRRALGCGAGGL